MNGITRKRVGVFLILAAAVPLVIASAAWACARLSVLHVNPNVAKAGATVSVIGRNYDRNAPVSIRLDKRTGPVVWSGTTDRSGNLSGSFAVPNVRPGAHILLAAQQTATGVTAAGQPARAVLRVTGTAARSRKSRRSVAPVAWLPAAPSDPGASDGAPLGGVPMPAAVAGGILALGLSGTGLMVLLGARRRHAGRALN